MKNAVAHHNCSRWISMEMFSFVNIYYVNVFCNYTQRLFFRFDVAGAGASLKRYSDPSFFKMEHASNMIEIDALIEKKPHRIKVSKKGQFLPTFLLKNNLPMIIFHFVPDT